MDKSTKGLTTAMVVLSATSMGIWILCSLFSLFFIGIGIIGIGFNGFFYDDELTPVFFTFFLIIIVAMILIFLALSIITFAFSIRGKSNNSKNMILVASIMFAVQALLGNFICIPGAICGFIAYGNMSKPHTDDVTTQNVDNGYSM